MRNVIIMQLIKIINNFLEYFCLFYAIVIFSNIFQIIIQNITKKTAVGRMRLNMNENKDSIDRVDSLIRKNNIKYLIEKQQIAYQQELENYKKQNKRQSLKLYAERIKEGNRQAIQKAKMNKKESKAKGKTRKVKENQVIQQIQEENKKNKLNTEDIKKIESAIEARADKILHQKQLSKLEKHLAEEKKKTKLYQLNERCRKLVKSQSKIPSLSQSIPEDRRKILEQFEKQAMAEVQQLDNIIENIVKNNNPKHTEPIRAQTLSKPKKKVQIVEDEQNLQNYTQKNIIPEFQGENNYQKYYHYCEQQEDIDQQQFLQREQISKDKAQNIVQIGFEHPLFCKTSQQLLALDYFDI